MTAAGSTARFYLALALIGGSYVVLILAMLIADLFYTTEDAFWAAFRSPEIRYAIRLSLVSCFVTTLLSLWVAVPLGYLLSRTRFYGQTVLDTFLDIPIVLPPLVIGLSLLILLQTRPGKWIEDLTQHQMGFLLTYIALPVVIAIGSWPLLRRLPSRDEGLLYLPVVAGVGAVVVRISGLGVSIEETT